MSYFDQEDNTYFANQGYTFGHLYSPMVADIRAMADLYGLSTTTRTGDTTYGFGNNSGRAIYTANLGTVTTYTIVDSGGIDTLNYSGFDSNQLINLTAETFSNVGGGIGNVSIGFGTVIENAIGGSGNDTILGNTANNVAHWRRRLRHPDRRRRQRHFPRYQGGPERRHHRRFARRRCDHLHRRNARRLHLQLERKHADLHRRLAPAFRRRFRHVRGERGCRRRRSAEPCSGWNSCRNPSGDFNGDGRSDILWRHDNGDLTEWLGTASGGFTDNGANAFSSVSTDWSVAGIGDFNGDNRDDILWRHDNGYLTEWLGTASGGFTDNGANAFSSVSTDWSVAGIGDFNGDNRDDILWRHDNGYLTEWLGTASGGFTDNGANAFSSVSTDWSVAGIGDFNGDNRDDILWRHDNGYLTEWLGTASGGFTDNGANAFSSVSTDWSVAGIGDFNGDNRDDILWRHDNGYLTEWLGTASGGFTDNGANAFSSVSTDWSVAGIGDFNGDNRDDILWRHDNGYLTEWLGTASGGFTDNGANAANWVPTQWHIQGNHDLLF